MTSEKRKLRILIVDDDPTSLLLLEKFLAATESEVWTATDGSEAMRMILDVGPDLVITDWKMPEMNGLELCEAIRSSEVCGFIYVILVTAYTDEDRMMEAFAAGVDDYLSKPYQRKELLARIRAAERIINLQRGVDSRARELHRVNAEMAVTANKLEVANAKLTLLATTDELTGLTNRREALARLREYWASAARHGEPLTCIMLDIDHFKNVNDTWGHDVGDAMLIATSRIMQEAARTDERVCRLGGEEFLIICPNTTARQALIAAERIRTVVENNSIQLADRSLSVTISLGVAVRSDDMGGPDDLLKASDEALYDAKRTGRNRVCVAGEMVESCPASECGGGEETVEASIANDDKRPEMAVASTEEESTPVDRKVLLVDPDPVGRDLCKQALSQNGCEVVDASLGDDVMAAIEKSSPDVVLVCDMLWRPRHGKDNPPGGTADSCVDIPLVLIGDSSGRTETGSDRDVDHAPNTKGRLSPETFAGLVESMLAGQVASDRRSVANEVRGEQARSMDLLLDYSRRLLTVHDMWLLLERTVVAAAELTCSFKIAILLPDREGKNLEVVRSIGLDPESVVNLGCPISSGLIGQVFRTGKAAVINSDEDARTAGHLEDRRIPRSTPMVIAPLVSSERAVGVLLIGQRFDKLRFSDLDIEFLDLLCNMAGSAIQNSISGRDRDEARDSIVTTLATLAETRDDDTGKHLERVVRYCLLLANELRSKEGYEEKIDDIFLAELERAVPLHDIGKVAIPDSILLKPGRLTEEEMVVMRRHAAIGADTIRSATERFPGSGFLRMAEQIARGHHERVDGKGYPGGLKGDAIPLPARIVAVADVYDALTTKRVYKEAMPHTDAAKIIAEGSGTQFDEAVVAAFVENQSEFERLADELADAIHDSGQTEQSVSLDGSSLSVPS